MAKPNEDIQAEVDALVQPLADYLVEHSGNNLPIAHRAGQLLRDASALVVTVAESPEPPAAEQLPEAPSPEAQKMAPLYEKASKKK